MVHQIGYKLGGMMHRFSAKLCAGLGKVIERFVEEMLYGIQARASVRLSEVAPPVPRKDPILIVSVTQPGIS